MYFLERTRINATLNFTEEAPHSHLGTSVAQERGPGVLWKWTLSCRKRMARDALWGRHRGGVVGAVNDGGFPELSVGDFFGEKRNNLRIPVMYIPPIFHSRSSKVDSCVASKIHTVRR